MRRNRRAGSQALDGMGITAFAEDELEAVHLATLEVLEQAGVWVEDDGALDIFADGRCKVDRETHVVKIPPDVVEEAIRRAPATFRLCGRDPANDVPLGGGRVGFTNFTEGIMMNDLETGENRPSEKSDVADTAKCVDAMSEIDVYCLAVGARDCPVVPSVHGYEAAIANTSKHIHIPAISEHEAKTAIEMAAFVAGGKDALRERPIVSLGCAPVSPLRLTKEFTDVDLASARAGLPTFVVCCAMAGATSPVTVAGTVVLHNAEVLAGLTRLQLAEPGTKTVYGSSTAGMDLIVGADAVGSPEMALMGAAFAQLTRYYRLPSFLAGL